ncbi:MAG: hypothetical protein MUC34_18425, partial [Anaerolineae bacterium]|nr:hypothetical protein [Anaerolineae bacterium]
MAISVDNRHLLKTKLYRPQAARDIIQRPRIWKRLDGYRDKAITLICAPAGFGKTTLLLDWLSQVNAPSAWFSIDSGDSDLGAFLAYFVSAVRDVFPHACQGTLRLIRAPQMPPLEPLVTALVNDLQSLADEPALPPGERLIVVLDDYHLLGGHAIHALIDGLLRHPPRCVHLIVSTRHDPPLALHALRASAALIEIRAAELRFTRDEVVAFMERTAEEPFDPEALSILMERTEGWATGLRLAALTLSAGGDVRSTANPNADNQYVMDYLANEVLTRVPTGTQEFIFKTSILQRLSGSLCDAIVPPEDPLWDGSAYLKWLTAENVFTFALDAQGIWYRYHHLFQTHAVNHAMAAGEEIRAAELIEASRHTAMNQGDWRLIERWLVRLPRGLIEQRPGLLLMEAWLLQRRWKFSDLGPVLQQIEDLLDSSTESANELLRAELDTLQCVVSYYVFAPAETQAFAERAVAQVPREHSFVRSMAWFYLASARQMTGDSQGAADTLREGLREDRLHNNVFTTRLYLGLCFLHWLAADLPSLVRMAGQMLQLGHQRNLPEATAWGHYFLGCARYQQNDLVDAESEFAAVLRDKYTAHGLPASQGALGLASVYLAQGVQKRARDMADEATSYGLEMSNSRATLDGEACRAMVALRTGAVAEAKT